MGNEYCYHPSKRPLGSSVFLVPNPNSKDDNSSSSGKENRYPSDHSIEEHNEKYKKETNSGIRIIDNDNTIESNNSQSFFREGVINSKIRFPGN